MECPLPTVSLRSGGAFGLQHGGYFGAAEAFTEGGGGGAVTAETEGADVGEVALAAAFDDREDVVGVPEAFAEFGFEAPVGHELLAAFATGAGEAAAFKEGVDVAEGAAALVAEEDLFAEVAGLGAEAPLVDAVCRAEGEAARRDLKRAPAAEAAVVGAAGSGVAGEGGAGDAAAGHGAESAHLFLIACEWPVYK